MTEEEIVYGTISSKQYSREFTFSKSKIQDHVVWLDFLSTEKTT